MVVCLSLCVRNPQPFQNGSVCRFAVFGVEHETLTMVAIPFAGYIGNCQKINSLPFSTKTLVYRTEITYH